MTVDASGAPLRNLDLLVPKEPESSDTWTWATVTQTSPLRVRIDGEAVALPITPDALIGGLQVGDRVWCQFVNRRVVVIGKPLGGSNTTVIGRQIGEPFFWLAPLTAPLPAGCLALEGGTASRAMYIDLWNLWGTTYGAGDGSTTFGLPDMRGKSPFGYDSGQTEFNAIGKTGGAKTHRHDFRIAMGFYYGNPAGDNFDGGVGSFKYSTGAYANSDAGSFAVTTAHNNAITTAMTSGGVTARSSTGDTDLGSSLSPYLVGRWLVKAAYTGAEVNPTTSALLAYPVGSIYMSVNATNPGTLFGGTWAAWGTGRVPVGVDTSQTEFNTVEETGGGKTHTHPLSDAGQAAIRLAGSASPNALLMRRVDLAANANTTHAISTALGVTASGMSATVDAGAALRGNTDSGSNLPPYITCYMWKRTA